MTRTSSSSNTIFPCSITCPISFAASTVSPVRTVWSPCLSRSAKVSTFSSRVSRLTENLAFLALTFKVAAQEGVEGGDNAYSRYEYPALVKTQGDFTLNVEAGEFTDSEIAVLLGENGTGKTTFIRLIAGLIQPDDENVELPEFNVSYKPQKIAPKFPGTVRELLHKKMAAEASMHPPAFSDAIHEADEHRPVDGPSRSKLVRW